MDVRMPDGTVITNVPDNITQSELLARYNKFNAPKIETAGMGEAFKGGAKRMFGSLETALSSPFGAEEAAKQGLARQEAITERPGASLEKVKQVFNEKGLFPAAREVVSQVPTAIAEQFPNLAATIGSARLGLMAGTSIAGPVGGVVGGIGGAFIPSLLQQTGSNLERQAREGAPISGSSALGAAVPQAALDVFTDRLLFSRLMGVPAKTLGRVDADAVVAKSIKRTIAEGTAKGVIAEVPTEVAQQMLERYQAGLSLTDDDARKEYADTMYQVALLGPLGAVGNIQERGEAKKVIAQDQAAQAQAAQQAQAQAERQATGVMEQQPLFTPEEAPIPEPSLTPQDTAAPISTIAPEEAVAEQPVPEGQGDLFTAKGKPSKDALASVETARLQGLPAQIEALNQTPEGRAELAGNMKAYFPDLSTQERNKLRPQIQAGTYGVEPVAAPDGTLTPEILKTYGITPRNGDNYKALAGSNLADPMTYTMLTTAAATNTDFGVKANRILEAYPQFNPNAVQPDLFGVPNAPQTQVQREPEQPDLFGDTQGGSAIDQSGTEQGLGEPVLSGTTPPTKVEEPDGAGVDVSSGPTDGDVGTPTVSPDGKPNTLAPIPKGVAKDAVAELKKMPLVKLWEDFETGIVYGKLSKIGKDRVREAVAGNFLTQELADEIARIEKGNIRATAAGKANKPEGLTAEAAELQDIEQPTLSIENKQIEELKGKTIVEVANWLSKNSPSKSYRVIANILAKRFAEFQKAGVFYKFEFTNELKGGTRGKSSTRINNLQGVTDIEVSIQNSRGGKKYEVVLHELIHAAVDSAIASINIARDNGVLSIPQYSKYVDQIIAVGAKTRSTIRQRVANGTASDFETKALANYNNAFANPYEFVAWGLSNPDMQATLDSIEMGTQGKTLWSEFVTVIRSLLGIPASANTALSEILAATEGLLNVPFGDIKGTITQSSPITSNQDNLQNEIISNQINPQAQAQAQQFIAGMSGTLAQSVPTQNTTTAQVLGNIGTTMVNNPGGALGMIEEMANRFRTKAIDKGAYLAAAIQDANAGAFYNVNGTIRADLLMSAANNVNNFINAVFTTGGMEILPNGSMRAKDANHSIDGVFRHAEQLGKQLGVEVARGLITGVFYHYRAKSIIDNVPRDQWPENWRKDPRIVPTPAQINAAMAAFNQYPELQAMQTEFIGAKNEMVKFLEQAGFLSDEKAQEFLADDSYAPWLRLKDYQDQIQGLGNTGKMVDLRQMKALVGGTEEVNDMLENMAQMIGWCVRSGVSNHTANSALSAMTSMGTATRHKMRPTSGNPAHVVMTYEAGKPVYHMVDNPYDLAAFQSVSGMNSAFMKAVGAGLGKLRAGIVLFPAFPIRQVVMDSQRAFVESGVDKPWAMMGKIYSSFLSGEAFRATSADMQDMMKEGVIGAVDYASYDSTRGRAGQFGMGAAPDNISDKFVASKGYQFLHRLAYSADAAVRLGIYRQTLEETGDRTLAAVRAREIINFQKSGTSAFVNTLKQTIPFMGAYLQGMDVNYKGMVGRGNSMKQRKAAAAAYWGNMATYAGLVILYTMMSSGDDEYEGQKGFITDRNFVIPGGGLIPVPPDVGFLAKVIPERITDYILQEGTDNPESAVRLRQGIIEAASTGFMPPAAVYGVLPTVELMTNYSFFSKMPIVSERLKGLEPSQQYTASTSEFAKNVGDVINTSPLQIDYLFNAIGGTSAGALLQLADVVLGSNKMAADKTPVIGSFQQKTVGGRYTEEYYATRELTERAYNTAMAIQAEGDEAKLEEYVSRPEIQARLQARDGIESLNTAMREVSRQRNAIIASPDLSPEEKREAVNELLASVEAGLRDMQIRRVRSELE